jgi:hypothetical protein
MAQIAGQPSAKERLAGLLDYSPETPREARNLLQRWNTGTLELPSGRERRILDLLEEMAAPTFHRDHEKDPKRRDRAKGRRMHKNRTGSRR